MTASEVRPWPALRPGDLVRVLSPASWPAASIDGLLETIRSLGFEVDLGDHVHDRHGYMAGTDRARAEDLDDAIADPRVRAIVASRGGAGAYRLPPLVDWAALAADPKPIVGFSDITYLHLAAARHGVGGIHGALVGERAIASATELLCGRGLDISADHSLLSAGATTTGRAEGRLIGGNLFAVASTVGTGLPSLDGAVLFLEDLRKHGLGVVDRQLTQLLHSGALDELAAVVLGSFEGFVGYEDRGWDLLDVLRDRLHTLGVPVLGGVPAGHDLHAADGSPDQVCLPIGGWAEVDADGGMLRVRPPVHGS